MKKTLVQIVKDILSDLDSEDVNSISDTVEALQVAKFVEQTFYDIISTRPVPEHLSLIKLTSLSDSDFPTHFALLDSQAKIHNVWYDTSDDDSFQYSEIKYLEPIEFLGLVDKRTSDYVLVDDKTAGTKLRIDNTKQPQYYTSFDDEHIVMDSYKATIDTTLTSAKSRAFGLTFPTFSISDSYVPDLDASLFPYLVQEAKSRAFSTMKGAIDQKTEQAARRAKVHVQNDQYRLRAPTKKREYGKR